MARVLRLCLEIYDDADQEQPRAFLSLGKDSSIEVVGAVYPRDFNLFNAMVRVARHEARNSRLPDVARVE